MKIYFTWLLIPVVIAALAMFWLVLRRDTHRLIFVSVLSVAVLALLNPAFAAIALGLILVAHQLVQLRRRDRLSGGRVVLIVVVIALVTLGVGKYGHSGVVRHLGPERLDRQPPHHAAGHQLLRVPPAAVRVRLPARRHRRTTRCCASSTFMMFIPTFPAGPLETYQGFYSKCTTTFDMDLFSFGLRRIALGYFKKVFVVGFLFPQAFSRIVLTVSTTGLGARMHPLWPISYCIIVFVRAYFDLSAYTDLAIGFSALFGFRIMENFHYPFLQKNLGNFWRSWHISLSSWCRNNVYFPVFGLTRKPWLGLYASMLTMGLWHYVGPNWTAWGLYHGSGLVVTSRWERWKKARRKRRKRAGLPSAAPYERFTAWLGYPATFLFVALGYAFVSTHTITQALTIIYLTFKLPLVWLTGHAA